MSSAPAAKVGALTLAAQDALRRDDIDAADALVAQLLELAPNDAATALLAGVVAYRRGDAETAERRFAGAAELAPAAAEPWYWLGNFHRRNGDFAQARDSYRRALALQPKHGIATFNLGRTLEDLDEDAEAGALFVRSARLAPSIPDTVQATIDCAARLARAGRHAPATPALPPAMHAPALSFVVCSITPAKLDRLRANLERVLGDARWELVHIGDARSLAEGHSRGLAQARGERIVFCHDDIELLAEDFAARLHAAFDGADLVGVFGTTYVSGPAVAWSGQPHLHGWVSHLDADGGWRPSVACLSGPRVDGVQALDGVFIAATRAAAEQIGFDAERYDGFHLYDLDFSYRAYRAGLRLRVQADLLLSHASSGRFDAAYHRYAERFVAQYPAFAATPVSRSPTFFAAHVDDDAQLRRFYGWLRSWL
jgi:tetratricopeptide (TPR) repeat protein